MNFKFSKMHHLGNDFIVVDFRPYEGENCEFARKFDETFSPDTVRSLCDRHFGIGADGVVGVLSPSREKYDHKMRIINSDGSEAKMCGNGLACFALFVCGFAQDPGGSGHKVKVETLSGARGAQITTGPHGGPKVILDMGKAAGGFSKEIKVAGRKFKINSVSMGNPHCVIFLDEPLSAAEFRRLGPVIENHELFPGKTNVEFVTVRSASEIEVAVWERGAGETLACGTGASASAFTAHSHKLCGTKVKVNLPGGRCAAEIKTGGRVFLECSPVKVFDGIITLAL
ncbi:MAG: diaminopimelate epimerase [Candidatus Wallbacteria bacterium GWC2_49_35]|uniref:Diaminopimelate epimerase n=1 Tax=Candidatus Wallbacteria bacterium GWC2_49_35 TaxID=1817813 RepID=A0A1F7WJ90_9BACT|nr:MAG: diaminopimelate epimerase [Candidatus Wallbacteria bacterium GWC2_49_35]HBC74123.1 diaminopimelate epimerase [Candidatus Wallbacteria bacterium]